jgi:hypothetical protein
MSQTGCRLSEMTDTFAKAGFVFVHDWRESHGNGGQISLQQANTQGRTPQVMVIGYDRDHKVTGVWQEREAKDYLQADLIRRGTDKERHLTERFVQVGSYTNSCGTAGSRTYVEYGRADGVWTVFGAAGHGESASFGKAPSGLDMKRAQDRLVEANRNWDAYVAEIDTGREFDENRLCPGPWVQKFDNTWSRRFYLDGQERFFVLAWSETEPAKPSQRYGWDIVPSLAD